ncbi:hypothetical protein LSH36_1027g01035 [Paralvinella palmiformis]|uniref:Uncharacterized protein n=1 Tax=Paralvinella palmiformis TaxID=53620 RepID=A0AAD9IVR4_9ANNE|nr:hypothetical protein LSH36_1027g01035 [Paralvinella palmiformis]
MDGFNGLSPLCERSLKDYQETVVYNLTSSKVLVNYFITSGQMEAEQSRGFWLSYRQIQDPHYSAAVTDNSEKAEPVIDYVPNNGQQLVQSVICIYIVVPLAITSSKRVYV